MSGNTRQLPRYPDQRELLKALKAYTEMPSASAAANTAPSVPIAPILAAPVNLTLSKQHVSVTIRTALVQAIQEVQSEAAARVEELEMQVALFSGTRAQLAQCLSDLEGRFHTLTTERANLSKDLAGALQAMGEIRDQLGEHVTQRAQWSSAVSSIEHNTAALHALNVLQSEKIKAHEASTVEMQKDLDRLHQHSSSLSAALVERDGTILRLQSELVTIQTRSAINDQAMDDLRKAFVSLTQQHEQLQERVLASQAQSGGPPQFVDDFQLQLEAKDLEISTLKRLRKSELNM